jgi:adenylate cyclase
MRTFEEVKADVKTAYNTGDAATLLRLADELDAFTTSEADAAAHDVRASACNLTGDYPAALVHYNAALALHDALGNRKGVAGATHGIGNVYANIGDLPAALEHYDKALTLHHEMGNRSGEAGATGCIGNIYRTTGDFAAALAHYSSALELHKELEEHTGVAIATGNIGNIYNATGNYPLALEHFNAALALYHKLGDRCGIALITGNIGNICGLTANYPAALEHYTKALELHQELGERSSVARVTGNMGVVHFSTGNYAAALEHFNKSLALYEEMGSRGGVANATSCILTAQLKSEDFDGARATLAALDALQLDSPDVTIQLEMGRATLHMHDGDVVAAQTTLANALELTKTHGLRARQTEICSMLRDLAQKRNDFAAYIEHNNEYTRITEEIRGQEATRRLSMIEAEKHIAAERAEKEKHKALLYNTLPPSIADRVLRGDVVNDAIDNAAIMFMDMVGFTTMSSGMDPNDVVRLLSSIFTACDAIMAEHDLMKIKTIGDSYMAASFTEPDAIANAARAAQHVLATITSLHPEIALRIGLHCGPVTAGVIGTQRMQYDVWGDTVNVASRMESTSEPGRIHISEAFAHAVQQTTTDAPFSTVERGTVEIKGKGKMTTYWLEGR